MKSSSAPLVAAYADVPHEIMCAPIDDTFTMWPDPRSNIAGSSASVRRTGEK